MGESFWGCSNSLSQGQLYDGYDEEYQCPILDEDRVSSICNIKPASDMLICSVQIKWFVTSGTVRG